MLELYPRVPFGPANDPGSCIPWPQLVSRFDVPWLKSTFVPDQRTRFTRVQEGIAAAQTHIDKLKAQAPDAGKVGRLAPNGNFLQDANDHILEMKIRTHAVQQLVSKIIEIRNGLGKLVPPILRDMSRASLTADTLRQRVFDKLSCLSRATLSSLAGPDSRAGFAALKANYATMLAHLSAIELTACAQRCIDDGSADALPLLDSIRVENFRRPKEDRGFLNASIIQLAQVPEFDQASALLDEVQQTEKAANLAWAAFLGQTDKASMMKMANALANKPSLDALIDGNDEDE
jgi:hypothetical protein